MEQRAENRVMFAVTCCAIIISLSTIVYSTVMEMKTNTVIEATKALNTQTLSILTTR